ncbi:hypothetical protein [Methyloceanibacter caenitepidi]|uniref:Uncharacterized protein n=1 Tax=Methyloceanibacter caenitepidi TaxID=1384459 RepID=A0A0A8K0U6_9HYPH|nr:hypothetical protein [Methyloceanibacter caenitepidi]BAQ15629.1 hypothetical protein GL4_0159 [Methyloceanibacter caenitepidi]
MTKKSRKGESNKGQLEGHLGQKRAQEEKESEEMLRNLKDSRASKSSMREGSKPGHGTAERK